MIRTHVTEFAPAHATYVTCFSHLAIDIFEYNHCVGFDLIGGIGQTLICLKSHEILPFLYLNGLYILRRRCSLNLFCTAGPTCSI